MSTKDVFGRAADGQHRGAVPQRALLGAAEDRVQFAQPRPGQPHRNHLGRRRQHQRYRRISDAKSAAKVEKVGILFFPCASRRKEVVESKDIYQFPFSFFFLNFSNSRDLDVSS